MQEMDNVHISSGMTSEGKPFCTITVEGNKRIIAVGQLPPRAVRAMALQWLCAAEAAEQDAAVYAVLSKTVGMSLEAVAPIVMGMREERSRTDSWFDTET